MFSLFSVDFSFATQEIQANHETLMKISAAGEREYSVSFITENWVVSFLKKEYFFLIKMTWLTLPAILSFSLLENASWVFITTWRMTGFLGYLRIYHYYTSVSHFYTLGPMTPYGVTWKTDGAQNTKCNNEFCYNIPTLHSLGLFFVQKWSPS